MIMHSAPSPHISRRAVLAAGAAFTAAVWTGASRAKDKTVLKVVLPYSAGGVTDLAMRAAIPSMETSLGRPVIIDNRPGAAGIVGTRIVQNAKPDGTTLLMHNIALVGNALIEKEAGYDAFVDFMPVAGIVDSGQYIIVHQSVPARTLAEFIGYCKSLKQELPVGTSGLNGASHLSAMLLAKRTGIKLLPVPYKGGAEMQTALISGEVKMTVSTMSEVFNAQVIGGRLRLLAATSDRRSQFTPALPLAKETVPGFVIEGWNGLFAPKGTSVAEISTVSAAVKNAIEQPGYRERVAGLYYEVHYQSPPELATSMQRTADFYRAAIRELQIS